MQNGSREALRFAILRVIDEADDGIADEDVADAVEYYVEVGAQSDVDDEVADLFACDVIERGVVDERWRLADKGLR